MRAWLLKDFGGLSSLQFGETPDPAPTSGEIVLRVLYAGLNPADRYLSEGQYPAKPSLPHILGRDGIGVIESLGAGVSNFKVGDKATIVRSEIGVSRRGTFAEKVAVPVESLVKPPQGWSDEQAAGATLVYLTAYQAMTQWTDPPLPVQGCVTLVSGASGGVGVASVQLASAMGHRVIGLSRSAEKAKQLIELGADAVFNPNDNQWRTKLKDYLNGKRVDLAIDNIGGELFPQVIETLGDRGRVSVVGRLAGPVPQFNTASLFFRRARIGGVAVGAYTPDESRRVWVEVLQLLDKTGAKPLVDQVFAFDKLIDAFERLRSGPMGKVLLKVAP
jgi:NADPH2:quinone reductase